MEEVNTNSVGFKFSARGSNKKIGNKKKTSALFALP